MVKCHAPRAIIAACTAQTFVRSSFVRLACLTALLVAAGTPLSRAQNARFDLTGPKVEVRVTRAGVMLPIAAVPNLQPGDRLWLHPDLPPTQSVRYLMVLAFLRGTTNPPPDRWFTRIATWERKVREEGVEVVVPEEAQQAVLFLAPVTGGDFTTLRSAVQGRPGIFVRASQDLAAAGFEQARIEKYIASMRQLSPIEAADPKQLQEHSNLLAATLALKPNGDCVKLPPDQQYTCLTQTGGQSLLDDGHGQSIVDALTSGSSAGLIGTVTATQMAGGGVYSAYVGAIVDLVHIMGSLHIARYQYIPAIAFPQQQSMNLRLNTPPSFNNPKSVIVIGLPSVQKTIPPPLRAANPNQVSCLQKPGVVLPVEGAPLVFSTSFAHDLILHLNYPAGVKPDLPQDIPLTPDAFRGGLALTEANTRRALPTQKTTSPAPPNAAKSVTSPPTPSHDVPKPDPIPGAELTGTVRGFWGFDTFTGPTMPLQDTPGKDWRLAGNDPADMWLIAGKGRHVLITSSGTACIQDITLEPVPGKGEPQPWKPADKPNVVDVTLDVPAHELGGLHLAIRQFGDPDPATVGVVSYNEPTRLDALHFHAGDNVVTLSGTGLDQVHQVEFADFTFRPAGDLPAENGKPELRLTLASDHKLPTLSAGARLTAHIALQDGRKLTLPLIVEPARPSVTIIGHADLPPDTTPKGQLHIKLASDRDLPVNDAVVFSLKSAQPFPRAGAIEIASPDGSLQTKLSLSDSDPKASLILDDPQTLLGTLQPLKAFGSSAFGPIRLRAVAPDGTAGDWLPLVTLVRLPSITSLSCPVAAPITPAPVAPARRPKPSSAPATETPTVPASATADTTPDTAAKDPSPAVAPATAPPASCTLIGSGLYFIDAVATDAEFTNSIRVPAGFVGSSLAVPPPTGAVYYLRLRDDPNAVDTVSLPAGPL